MTHNALRMWLVLVNFSALLEPVTARDISLGSKLREFQLKMTSGSPQCKHKVKRPSSVGAMECPWDCAYVRPDPTRLCFFACVAKEDCDNRDPLVSYANPRTMTCEACLAPGCQTCGADAHDCLECEEGLDMVPGEGCLPSARRSWKIAYSIAGVLIVIFLWYVFWLTRRENVNDVALLKAYQFRSFSKNRDPCQDHQLFRFSTDLRNTRVSGVGVMLHFEWQRAVLIWVACLAFLMIVLAYVAGGETDSLAMLPSEKGALDACAEAGKKAKRQNRAFEEYFFLVVLAVYIFSFVGAIWFAIRQRRKTEDAFEGVDTMQDFAVLAKGFPKETGDKDLESEYTEFFKKAFPDDTVIGVSIVWDTWSSDFAPKESIDRIMNGLDRAADGHETQRGIQRSKTQSVEDDPGKRSCAKSCDWKFSIIDSFFIGFNCGTESPDISGEMPVDEKKEAEEATLKSLQQLQTTGEAFVVFGNKKMCVDAVSSQDVNGNLKFRDEHDIKLRNERREPDGVLWDNFGCSPEKFYLRILGCIVGLLVGIVVWGFTFYYPYAHYVLSYSRISGMSQGSFVQGTMLGLVIVVGNQIIYLLCQVFSERAGFRYKGMLDRFYVTTYTFAIFINICLDLWTVLGLAYGYQTDSALAVAEENSVIGTKALAKHPTLQHALYVQMLAYLYPGTLLIPFLIEPLMLGVIPFYLGTWLVRSNKRVGIQGAEECLACVPYDLSRYGDILINIELCILVFFLASVEMWQIMCFLLISCLIINIWDRYRVLRVTQRTFFGTSEMDETMSMMASFPCAMLASCVVFRAYGVGQNDFLPEEATEHLNRYTVWYAMIGVGCLHIVLHLVILRFVVPRFVKAHECVEHHEGYAKCSERLPCNWFNANPVQCLRSKYIKNDSPICVPYQIGREYLLQKNAAIGCHYYSPTFCPEEGSMDDMKELYADAKQGVYSRAAAVKSGVTSVAHKIKDEAAYLKKRVAGGGKEPEDAEMTAGDGKQKTENA